MKYPPVVFIAGERQHAGKTTTSLGVISALCQYIDPSDIGYFKPVGQEMVTLSNGERIDKDVLVIKEFTDLDIQTPETLSPVRVVSGVTRNYIQSNNREIISKRFENAITKSFNSLSKKKLIIAEGTGHPGVGSVVGLSNARVANLLNARILYLVGGGIGRTLDELEVDLSYFEHHKSQVGGVLFNKVIPSKLEQMSSVLTEEAIRRIFCSWNPPLNVFGYMPQVDYLNNPSMELISLSFPSMKPLNGALNSESGKKPCRKVKIISQDYEEFNPYQRLRGRDIAVIAAGTHRRLKQILEYSDSLNDDSIGGIILTCASDDYPDSQTLEILSNTSVPAIAVEKDTAETDQVLYQCFRNTKLQLYDRNKHQMIIDLFQEHFDAELFIKTFLR